MEGVTSGVRASGGCQLDALSCEKAACSAEKCPTFRVECESSGAEPRKNVVSSINEPCAEVSDTLTVGGEGDDRNQTSHLEPAMKSSETMSRKEKRKHLKKLRRKQIRQEAAEKETLIELARSQDPAERLRIQEEEKLEAERSEKERLEHEVQERLFEEREKKAQEEFERKQAELLKKEQERKIEEDEEENWRYIEDDGPAEIIWQGNEIIVKKKLVKVPAEQAGKEPIKNADQPTSNPMPPQSVAFAAHKYPPPSTLDAGEQNPAFGTEQDKTHCPFHIKTGVCRFGTRCSRVHVYPDQSFTLLMRNMYTGPGLSWDHDEGLEVFQGRWKLFWRLDDGNGISSYHSDEEVAEQYEEFYEDVHSEFLQFGELVNFKVCKNGSSHLRGNVYVHYQTEAGAQAAYNAMNGRFYAGKQITCEFVGVTRWRVALCGEYMKGHHRPCSHGSACNFLHCFRNPRGEYDWADWDSPPPRYWIAKMAKVFGFERDHREDDDSYHDKSRKRHRSSERDWSPERRHRSKDRYSRVDDSEVSRHRARRRHTSRDESYHSSSDEFESSFRHERRRRNRRSSPGLLRQGSRRRSSGDLNEKGRRYHRDSVYNRDTAQEEVATMDCDELDCTDRDWQYGRDHEVDGDDADELHRPSRTRKRGTTAEKGHHKNKSRSRFSTRSRSRDVQIQEYRLSNWHKSRRGRSSSGSPQKEDAFVLQASEIEDESVEKCRKRELAERDRSVSKRGSRSSYRRSPEGDSSDAGTDKTHETSKNEPKRDSRRILPGKKRWHEHVHGRLVEHEDRWRPDVDIYQ